jgi:hypothetical protein
MTGKESKKEKESSPKAVTATISSFSSEEKKTDGSDDTASLAGGASTSAAGEKQPKTSSSSTNKNWLGKEVKRPRAEYQAEIDELKLKLAELESDLENKTDELQQFKDWVSMAPSAF